VRVLPRSWTIAAQISDRVLEESAEVRVMPGSGARGAPPGRPQIGVGEQGVELEVVAKATDPADHADEVAGVEAAGREVGVAEDATGDRAGPVAELDRGIRTSVAGEEPLLARAGEHAVDGVSVARMATS
jgi:hypothetical protein